MKNKKGMGFWTLFYIILAIIFIVGGIASIWYAFFS